MRGAPALAFLLAASPALAQPFEITPLVSVTTSASIDRTAAGIQDLTVDRSFSWGSQVGYFFSTHVGIEALWTYQSTALSISAASRRAEVMTMTTEQAHGTIVYQFGGNERTARPFVFAGLGGTLFRSPGLESETKASWTVGAGLKWFLRRKFGVEMRGRYKPTMLDDEKSSTCRPFGFCQNSLNRLELADGAIFRF
jgi:outer membrane protein W